MYRLSFYGKEYSEFTVVKETDKQVTYLNFKGIEVKENKRTSNYAWFDTEKQCVEHIVYILKRVIKSLEQRLIITKRNIDVVNESLIVYNEILEKCE